MKVCLLDIPIKGRASLDCMGGYGLGSAFGRSWFTKLIARGKRNGVNLPLMDYGLLAGIHKAQGDEVIFGGPEEEASRYYIHHSLVGYDRECEAIRGIPSDRVCKTGPLSTRRISALNSPWPDWFSFDYRSFSYFPSLKVKPTIPVLASEGCKFTCSYCPYSAHYGGWTPRPVEDVARECQRNVEEYRAKGIVFRDPLFSGNIQRTRELCEAIQPFNLEWACETRLECLDKETICAMAWAGCKSIHVGIESASKLALSDMNRRNLSVSVMRDMVGYIRGQGVKVLAFFILGLPEDTVGSCEATIRLSTYLNPDLAEFFIATPYPNTPLYDRVKDKLLTKDYSFYNGYTPVFEHEYLTSNELIATRERAYKAFYIRPRFLCNYLGRIR